MSFFLSAGRPVSAAASLIFFATILAYFYPRWKDQNDFFQQGEGAFQQLFKLTKKNAIKTSFLGSIIITLGDCLSIDNLAHTDIKLTIITVRFEDGCGRKNRTCRGARRVSRRQEDMTGEYRREKIF